MNNGFDHDLEREVLGAMLNHYDDFLIGIGDLDEKDFGSPLHQDIFKTFKAIFQSKTDVPSCGEVVFAFAGEIQDGLLETIVLMKEENSGVDIRYMISLMMELRTLRKLFSFSDRCKTKGQKLKRAQYADFVKESLAQFSDVAQDGIQRTEYEVSKIAKSSEIYEKAIQNQQLRKEGKSIYNGIPTGFVDIDKKIYGLAPGHLIVIGGRPGEGKSSMLVNLCNNMKEVKCAVFSMEMTAMELTEKLTFIDAKVKYENYKDGNLTTSDINNIYGAQKALMERTIIIDDRPALSPSQMYTKLLRFKKIYGLDIAFIDYLQLMSGDDRSYENNQTKVASVSRALKAMAKECNIPIVALAQLNRQMEGREGPPKMSDLRESGAIEADADAILLLHRPKKGTEYTRPGILEIHLVKNRYGKIGSVDLNFQTDTGRMTSYQKISPEEEEHLKKFQDFTKRE